MFLMFAVTEDFNSLSARWRSRYTAEYCSLSAQRHSERPVQGCFTADLYLSFPVGGVFPPMAYQPLVDHVLLIMEVSRSDSDTTIGRSPLDEC
jgi:hypothetical protein